MLKLAILGATAASAVLLLTGCGHRTSTTVTTAFTERQVRDAFAARRLPLRRTVFLSFAGIHRVRVLYAKSKSFEIGNKRLQPAPSSLSLSSAVREPPDLRLQSRAVRAYFRAGREPTAVRGNLGLVAYSAVVPANGNVQLWRKAKATLMNMTG